MKFETQHSFGDVVYKIWQEREKVFVPCGFCDNGTITGKNGTETTCPECWGRLGEYVHENLQWRITGQLTVGEIRIEAKMNDPVGIEPDSIFSNYGPQEGSYKESYMCKETGIGSGSIHYVETLFKTKEEAQTECNRLDAEGVKV